MTFVIVPSVKRIQCLKTAYFLRDVPSFGVYTFTYEAIAHWEPMQRINENLRTIFAGGMAGILTQITLMGKKFGCNSD